MQLIISRSNAKGSGQTGLAFIAAADKAVRMNRPEPEPKKTFHVADLDPVSSYKLATGLVVPRPIGWIGTTSDSGVHNLAPYSFFNVVAMHPPTFVVAPVTTGRKDTLTNIESSGVFTVNVVTEDTVDAMNATAASLDADVDEFDHVGLTAVSAETIRAPMVSEAVANFECRVTEMIPVGAATEERAGLGTLIIAEASRIHIAERVVSDDLHIDQVELRAVGRHVGNYYTRTADSLFEIARPA